MDKLDEKIISMRKQQKNQNINIEKGVYIDHSLIEFVEVEAFDGQITVLIPSSFKDIPTEHAKIKYPSESRPQIIKTLPNDTSVNLCLSLIDCPITEQSLEDDAREMKNLLKKTNPAMEFYKSNIEQLEDFKLAWFEFKSFAIDGQMFNIMFVAPAHGQMLQGVFNCFFDKIETWQKPALEIIKSLKYTKKEAETVSQIT